MKHQKSPHFRAPAETVKHDSYLYPIGARALLPPPAPGRRWVLFVGLFGEGYIDVAA